MKWRNDCIFLAVIFCAIIFYIPGLCFAQNLADVSSSMSESAGEKDSDNLFQVEPLDGEQKDLVQSQIASLVKESEIPQVAFSTENSQYTLGPTDVIEIKVMRHPEVSGEYVINMEGKIQYEFVGDVVVAGLNKEQTAETIKKVLGAYIISPEVTVKIIGYNSKIVYVVGEVAHPGKIYMRGDTISVREALMQAGLPMLSGITKKSKLITPSEDGNPLQKNINVYALLYEGDLRENATMKPGDVLYVPPTFLTKTIRALTPVTTPIGNAAGTARTVTGF